MQALIPVDWPRCYVFTALTSWGSLSKYRLVFVPSPPIFSYYSNLALEEKFRSLISTAARTELAVCTTVQFLSRACGDPLDTFGFDDRLAPSSRCII